MIRSMKKQETVRMLTTKETAEKLSADPGTVRMWCINGTFPNAKQEDTPRGPVWLIPETDLDGFERRGRGRPKQKTDSNGGEASTATDAPDDALPAAVAGKPAKKAARKKGGDR
jgi:hypothetical protein